MKYKTLCRLLVKLMGVFFIGQGLVYVIGQAVAYLQRPLNWESLKDFFLGSLGWGTANLVVGGYLFFGGKWVVDRLIPSNRPYCHECGYDLNGAAGNRCPECGTAFQAAVGETEPHH